MKKQFFLVLIFFLFPISQIVITNSAIAKTYQSPYPEVLQTSIPYQNIFYNFTPTNNNKTVSFSFSLAEFRDVTFADVLLEETGQLVSNVTITAHINGVNASNIHQESDLFDQEQFLFVLDDHAMLLPKNTNDLTFQITVNFRQAYAWEVFKHPYYMVRFDSIIIKTVNRQQVNANSSELNQSNSAFTALIFDPSYSIATQGVIFGNTSNVLSLFAYQLEFYIIMPKNMQSDYYLNISFSFDHEYSIRSINIDQFGLVSSSNTANGIRYTFRYINNTPSEDSLIKGVMQFNPKASGIYHIDISGNFFITKNFVLWPGSPEMDLFLFINASLIIPLIFLSKLIYRRLFY